MWYIWAEVRLPPLYGGWPEYSAVIPFLFGFAPLGGFRWHELLKRAAPQPREGFPEIEVIPN